VAEAELKKLKEKAKVEYLGEYADAGKQAAAPEATPAPATAQPSADASAIEKGVSGLK
jgi:hypothetical protein